MSCRRYNGLISLFQNRTNNSQSMPVGAGGGGNSLSSMLTGGATATANGNTPQSLEQLLERQWEQGSQFLMEQAQHFDSNATLNRAPIDPHTPH